MTHDAVRFFESMRGKRIALMGIGVSNTGLIKLLREKGAIVTACDRRERDMLGDTARELEAIGVRLKLGEGYFDDLDAEILFRTPGMNYNLPQLREFRERGGIVTSEMEVFFDVCPCPIIAVTGSDGKTTTSTLIASMLEAEGKTAHLGGNIGRALLTDVLAMKPKDYAVVELSSFQLISVRTSPDISVVTNITPNHLDVHRDMQEYITAKKNIFLHQNAFSRTVLSLDNEITASFAPEVRGERMMFSRREPVSRGAWLDSDGNIYLELRNESRLIMNASDIKLPGEHNISNYLAAICALAGIVKPETVLQVAKTFGGVEHRIELVRELNGVKWYNDSIATTPTRAVAAIKSFERGIILIAGGYDKNLSYDSMTRDVVENVRLLILTGATAAKIESAITALPGYTEGKPAILHAADMCEAVSIARQSSQHGDVVLLSPASASFDAYKNFEERGRHFKALVNSLE